MIFPRLYLPGGRILKTGIAVFLTVAICRFFEFPVIFAVITAIVSIEPTAADSIKKGVIRFPAAVIGAAYSMSLTALFGDAAITYALSAMLTILTCTKLKLHAGTLVAALTAVNMIPVTADHYFLAFLERVATTSIGIVTAALVNLLILPPDYSKTVANKAKEVFETAGKLLYDAIHSSLYKIADSSLPARFEAFMSLHKNAERLCRYQTDEWKFHQPGEKELQELHSIHEKLILLKQIGFHIGNIIYLPLEKIKWTDEERQALNEIADTLSRSFAAESTDRKNDEKRQACSDFFRKKIIEIRTLQDKAHNQETTAKIMICYELLAINRLMDELQVIKEKK